MSLINQPIKRNGIYIRRIDFSYETSVNNVNVNMNLGTILPSTSFATSTETGINITETGKYRISLDGYVDFNLSDNDNTFVQFAVTAGSYLALRVEKTGTNPGVSDFTYNRMFLYGQTYPSGGIFIFTARGFAATCWMYGSNEVILQAGDIINLNLQRTGGTHISSLGFGGHIYVEQIS